MLGRPICGARHEQAKLSSWREGKTSRMRSGACDACVAAPARLVAGLWLGRSALSHPRRPGGLSQVGFEEVDEHA
jgi:hypothetical protein